MLKRILRTPALKSFVYILSLCFLAASQVHAQGSGMPLLQGARERIEAQRIAYYNRVMELNAEEAKVFWPVYNEYQTELEKNQRARAVDQYETRVGFSSMTDAELEKMMNQMFTYQEQELAIHKKYNQRFRQVLSVRKVALLYYAERQFKRELLKRLGGALGGDGGLAPR